MKDENIKIFTIAAQGVKNPCIVIDGKSRSYIEVQKGSLVRWSVSAEGFHEQHGDILVVSDVTINVQLRQAKKTFPDENFMKIRPEKGAYRVKYVELYRDMLPPVEGHDDEYLYTKDGFLFWKKLDVPFPPPPPPPPGPGPFPPPPPCPPYPHKPCYEMSQVLGSGVDIVLSQKAITNFLSDKADATSVYTKSVIDEMMDAKEDKGQGYQNIPAGDNVCVIVGADKLKKGDKVLFNNATYYVGINAFGNIKDAIASGSKVILIGQGEYVEDVEVPEKYTKLIGFEGALIRGSVTFKKPTGCGIYRIKVLYECSYADVCEDTDTALKLEGDYSKFDIDDVDIIVKGTAHTICASGQTSNMHIRNSRLVAGFLRNKEEVASILFRDFCESEIRCCSIFGGIVFAGVICDSSVLANTIIANKKVALQFTNCSLERKIDLFENRVFGKDTEYTIEWNNIKADDLTTFNIFGNCVSFSKGFVHLLNGQTGLTNSKVVLAYNTCNNAIGSAFFVDDNEVKSELGPGEGNIYATGQNVTIEEVEQIVRIERLRAQSEEARLEEKIDSIAPSFDTLEKQTSYIPSLQWQLQELKDEDKTLTLVGGGDFDKGQTLTETDRTITWTIPEIENLEVSNQEIKDTIVIEKEARSYTFPEFVGDKEAILKVDFKSVEGYKYPVTRSFEKEVSFLFKDRFYFGVSDKETLLPEEVVALESKLTSSVKGEELEFDCEGGKFVYFAVVKTQDNDLKVKFNGWEFSAFETFDLTLTNQYGYSAEYTVYRTSSKHNSKLQLQIA